MRGKGFLSFLFLTKGFVDEMAFPHHMKIKESLDPNPFNTPNKASATAGSQLSPWQPKQIVSIAVTATKDKRYI